MMIIIPTTYEWIPQEITKGEIYMFRPAIRNRNNYDMMDYFNDLNKNFWEDFPDFGDFGSLTSSGTFRTDITDEGSKYRLEAELPGMKKEDIKLNINGDYLTISAEHTDESEDKDEKRNYVRRERSYGSYSRSFNVSDIDVNNIEASYENGILALDLPKKQPEAPASHQIEIK